MNSLLKERIKYIFRAFILVFPPYSFIVFIIDLARNKGRIINDEKLLIRLFAGKLELNTVNLKTKIYSLLWRHPEEKYWSVIIDSKKLLHCKWEIPYRMDDNANVGLIPRWTRSHLFIQNRFKSLMAEKKYGIGDRYMGVFKMWKNI